MKLFSSISPSYHCAAFLASSLLSRLCWASILVPSICWGLCTGCHRGSSGGTAKALGAVPVLSGLALTVKMRHRDNSGRSSTTQLLGDMGPGAAKAAGAGGHSAGTTGRLWGWWPEGTPEGRAGGRGTQDPGPARSSQGSLKTGRKLSAEDMDEKVSGEGRTD